MTRAARVKDEVDALKVLDTAHQSSPPCKIIDLLIIRCEKRHMMHAYIYAETRVRRAVQLLN